MKNKLIIVAGCSGSGKTTVCNKIQQNFGKNNVQILCLDRFYKPNASKMPKTKDNNPNFDHPDSFDWSLAKKTLRLLLNNQPAKVPVYDYANHKRSSKWEIIQPAKILIFEGFLTLYDDQINNMASLKVFIDVSLEQCFLRRMQRDQVERKRTIESIKNQWNETVKPMYDLYVEPNRSKAAFFLSRNEDGDRNLQPLISLIKPLLRSNNV